MTQEDAPWGLKRLSKDKNTSGSGSIFAFEEDFYKYPSSAGKDVDVYIIDTGINVEHEDFEGRAKWGKTIPRLIWILTVTDMEPIAPGQLDQNVRCSQEGQFNCS